MSLRRMGNEDDRRVGWESYQLVRSWQEQKKVMVMMMMMMMMMIMMMIQGLLMHHGEAASEVWVPMEAEVAFWVVLPWEVGWEAEWK